MMTSEQKALRQMILSGQPDTVELALEMNLSLRLFPNVADFYMKHKRYKFWIGQNNTYVRYENGRYERIVTLLMNELKDKEPMWWVAIDFTTSTRFLMFHKHISDRSPWERYKPNLTIKGIQTTLGILYRVRARWTRKYMPYIKCHPLTKIFIDIDTNFLF